MNNLSKTVIVIELNEKFMRAYNRAKKRAFRHSIFKIAAIVILVCYIYDNLETMRKEKEL
jgi:hypothetical protein